MNKLTDKKILLVTTQRGRRRLIDDTYMGRLLTSNSAMWVDNVTENPGLSDLQYEINRLLPYSFDAVVGFGGGSALDTAKVLSVALSDGCRRHSLQELLNDMNMHRFERSMSLYTVPTTAGTGSEVTPFATVWDHQKKRKHSLASAAVFPCAAYVDASLTDNLPLEVTISTGLDAINQAAESVWNRNAIPITLSFAFRALQLGFAALPKLATGYGGDSAREQMAEASLLAGLAISHTRTALCHSISYPISAHFHVPHGLACAFTMPAVLKRNLEADDGRFAQLAVALTGKPYPEELTTLFAQLHETLDVKARVKKRIPNLDALLALEPEMFTTGRSDNNLARIEDLRSILHEAWII